MQFEVGSNQTEKLVKTTTLEETADNRKRREEALTLGPVYIHLAS